MKCGCDVLATSDHGGYLGADKGGYLGADKGGELMKNHLIRIVLLTMLSIIFAGMLNAQNRLGTYYRSDEYGRGDITFKEVGSGKSKRLNFYVSIAGAQRGTCIGDHRGKAKWIESNVAEYNGDFNEVNSDGEAVGCRLTFVFAGNRVTVRETNCNDFHGVSCQFEGKYTLRRKSR